MDITAQKVEMVPQLIKEKFEASYFSSLFSYQIKNCLKSKDANLQIAYKAVFVSFILHTVCVKTKRRNVEKTAS